MDHGVLATALAGRGGRGLLSPGGEGASERALAGEETHRTDTQTDRRKVASPRGGSSFDGTPFSRLFHNKSKGGQSGGMRPSGSHAEETAPMRQLTIYTNADLSACDRQCACQVKKDFKNHTTPNQKNQNKFK